MQWTPRRLKLVLNLSLRAVPADRTVIPEKCPKSDIEDGEVTLQRALRIRKTQSFSKNLATPFSRFGLIIRRSQVRVLVGPPSYVIVTCSHYPGPLIVRISHKGRVLRVCERVDSWRRRYGAIKESGGRRMPAPRLGIRSRRRTPSDAQDCRFAARAAVP